MFTSRAIPVQTGKACKEGDRQSEEYERPGSSREEGGALLVHC